MKFPALIKRQPAMKRDRQIEPLPSHVESVRSNRLAAGELLAVGAADDLASFIIEEIERLSESIARGL